jgi:hypothetical protein
MGKAVRAVSAPLKRSNLLLLTVSPATTSLTVITMSVVEALFEPSGFMVPLRNSRYSSHCW